MDSRVCSAILHLTILLYEAASVTGFRNVHYAPRRPPLIFVGSRAINTNRKIQRQRNHQPVASLPERLVETITVPAYADDNSTEYPSSLHHIHVCSILSDDQAAHALALATAHAQETNAWDRLDRERHATYSTCDFVVEDCPDLDEYLTESCDFHTNVLGDLSHLYGIPTEHLEYLDFFCAHYTQTGPMDRLEAHRDGSLLSFTVTLSPPADFAGGGTFFDALPESDRVVRPSRAGNVVYHCGKLLHGADVVTAGDRTVLVGFVDVTMRQPTVLGKACKEWGRMDEAKKRLERQKVRKGLPMQLHRWLPYSNSVLASGATPTFATVEKRADPEFQRMRKLKAEDMLLRTAL